MLIKIFKLILMFFTRKSNNNITMKNNSKNNNWINNIDLTIKKSVNQTLPGAVIGLYQNNKTIYKNAIGYQRKYTQTNLMDDPQDMSFNTIFDLASLTKIFSTTLSYMYLVDKKELDINDKVSKYLPEFKGGDKTNVEIKDLMHHSSGLPSSVYFYNPKRVAPKFYSQDRNNTIKLLPLVDLVYKPNSKVIYSDVGYMILGAIIEKVTNMRQDHFVAKEIYNPLKLDNTGYRLMEDKGFPKSRFEATEICGNTREGNVDFPNIRTKTVQGQVQDEKAFYSMGGISGHAGLFSNLDDLKVLSTLILNKGYFNSFKLCSEEVFMLFKNTKNFDNSYSLGFQIPSEHTELIFGIVLKTGIGDSIGHTGWTGKCFLIDFKFKSIFLLLTNKKHSHVIPYGGLYEFYGDLTPTSKYGEIADLFYAYNLKLSI